MSHFSVPEKKTSIFSQLLERYSFIFSALQKKTPLFSHLFLLINRNSCNKSDGDDCFRQLPLNCLTGSRRHLRQLPINGYLHSIDMVGLPYLHPILMTSSYLHPWKLVGERAAMCLQKGTTGDNPRRLSWLGGRFGLLHEIITLMIPTFGFLWRSCGWKSDLLRTGWIDLWVATSGRRRRVRTEEYPSGENSIRLARF